MNIFGKRLPFELAEPGTDPTSQARPRPRRNSLRDNRWLVIGLVVFLGFGYFKFVRKPDPRQAVTASPTPKVVASPTPAPSPGGFFDGGGDTGFFPTPVTEAPPPACTVYCYASSPTDEICEKIRSANLHCAVEVVTDER